MNTDLTSVFSLDFYSDPNAVNRILSCNNETSYYGLSLTPQDAAALMKTREEELRFNGRVEVGSETIIKLIEAFCDSCYITQNDYAETLQQLIEIFYGAKTETEDRISDDELIAFLRNSFETRCGGSLEALYERDVQKLAENLRNGVKDYTNMNPDEEETEEEYDE